MFISDLKQRMEVSPFQGKGGHVRELAETERQKLEQDVCLVSEFKQNKLETEAKKNWDLFYKRNTTKFFKDRHWTTREFEDLVTNNGDDSSNLVKRTVFEVGCGVGNFMFPLMSEDPNMNFYACDFSPRAVDFVKASPKFDASRCIAFPCDITQATAISTTVPSECVDIATLIFVLSAIHPDKMVTAVSNIVETLRPKGILLIRDYGLYDHAMLRFSKGHKLADNFYVRQDGTRAFYFSLEMLDSVMSRAGLEPVHSTYIQRSTVNKKEGLDVCRIFVQGKYCKTNTSLRVAGGSGNMCEQMDTCADTFDNLHCNTAGTCSSSNISEDNVYLPTENIVDHFDEACNINE